MRFPKTPRSAMPEAMQPFALVLLGVIFDEVAKRPAPWLRSPEAAVKLGGNRSDNMDGEKPDALGKCGAAGRRDQRSRRARSPEAVAHLVFVFLLALVQAGCKPSAQEQRTVAFKLDADGFASIQIKSADGQVVRKLATARAFPKGAQQVVWDGLDDAQQPVPPGEYHWAGATHTGIRARLRGWACADFGTPWRLAEGRPQWGGDSGVPSAVAADSERVYLGWSGAISGTAVVACDLDGKPLWGWRDDDLSPRVPGGTGVKAIAVDAGVVTVLYGIAGLDIKGWALIRLDARTGAPIPWPDGRRFEIDNLWPPDAKTKPLFADGMAARAGRIYLTFTEAQFLAVLDAQTGAYLQTVVGAPPELIDAVPTKTESVDKPGELMDADFVLVSLRGGVLGKVLFVHDPLWVVTSDLQALDREERITALTVLGDGAQHHKHTAFVGLGAPFHQVQRRGLLDPAGFQWSAGPAGGRQPGPWVPEALGPIRGVALDARGRLWVAEGDAAPPRISVWATEGNEGRLVREFFGPTPFPSWGTLVFPGDPDVFVGAGCEWRLDPQTGQARCTGVITSEYGHALGFHRNAAGGYELLIRHEGGEVSRLERIAEGHYELRRRGKDVPDGFGWFVEEKFGGHRVGVATLSAGGGAIRFVHTEDDMAVVTAEDLVLARLFKGSVYLLEKESLRGFRPAAPAPGLDFTAGPLGLMLSITQGADGRIFFATAEAGLWNGEITGLDSIRVLPGGELHLRGGEPGGR